MVGRRPEEMQKSNFGEGKDESRALLRLGPLSRVFLQSWWGNWGWFSQWPTLSLSPALSGGRHALMAISQSTGTRPGNVWVSWNQLGHALHQQNSPPCGPLKQGELLLRSGPGSQAMLRWVDMFSPAIFKIHRGFSPSAGAPRGGWARADWLLEGSTLGQSACARSPGCPPWVFPALQLCPEVPCSLETTGTAATVKTYFCPPAGPLCFRIVLLQAGRKQTEMHSSNAA